MCNDPVADIGLEQPCDAVERRTGGRCERGANHGGMHKASLEGSHVIEWRDTPDQPKRPPVRPMTGNRYRQ
jgi:hypothetical protein